MITKTDIVRAKELLKTNPKKEPEKYLDLFATLIFGKRGLTKRKKEIDDWYQKNVVDVPELD